MRLYSMQRKMSKESIMAVAPDPGEARDFCNVEDSLGAIANLIHLCKIVLPSISLYIIAG